MEGLRPRRRARARLHADSTEVSRSWTYHNPATPAFGAFTIRNDEGGYYGAPIPLWEALAVSDNRVFAHVGLEPVASARGWSPTTPTAFGITTTISINPSMVIGGLAIGVTPLDMAHAYETIANYGRLTSGTLVSDTCAGDLPGGNPPAYQWEDVPPIPSDCSGAVGIESVRTRRAHARQPHQHAAGPLLHRPIRRRSR